MSAGEETPTYGQAGGPQDGQIKPIPVPSAPTAARSDAEAMALAKREARRRSLNGVLAISGTLALAAFMVIGMVFNGWAWGWIVFLIPGMLRTYLAKSE